MKRHLKAAVVLVVLLPSAAHAQPPPHDVAGATSLFYEARDLMAKGRYAEACPKLEESLRLDAGIGTQFNLADCNEHVGKLATAWAGFVDVAAQAKTAGQAAREKIARQRAEALAPRVPKVAIDVATPPPGLQVRRDGVVVGSAAYGAAVPVDPGSHTIQATAPGKQPWESTVHVTEGKTARAAVPALADAVVVMAPQSPPPPPEETPGAPVEITAAPTAPPAFPEPVDERTGSTQRTVGYVVGTMGIAGLAVAGAFGLRSIAKRDDARPHCQGDVCDTTGVGLRDDAIRAGNVATGAAIAGGIALVGGILLVVTAPRASHPTVSASPVVSAHGGGLSVGGSF